jgi:hypothetical protein
MSFPVEDFESFHPAVMMMIGQGRHEMHDM